MGTERECFKVLLNLGVNSFIIGTELRILCLAVPVWVACSVGPVSAQGEFLEKGQSGFGLEGYAETGQGNFGMSASAGYSISGVFDLGISCSWVQLNERDWGKSAEATGWGPWIGYHLVKHTEIIPYSVSVFASYNQQKYSGLTSGSSGRLSEARTTLFGMLGQYRFPAGVRSTIIAGAGIAYAKGTLYYSRYGGGSPSVEHGSFIKSNLSILLSFKASDRHQFIIGPSMSVSEYLVSGGFSLEYVLGGSVPAAADKVHHKAGGGMNADQR